MEKITPSSYSIMRVASRADITSAMKDSLVQLLKDAVDNNFSVGFMKDSTDADFDKFWSGCVIVTREQRANGRHRGELRKLLVHSKAQGMGIGTKLEEAATSYARQIGLTLLYLDSATNFLVNGVYEKWGWSKSGEIPQFAKNPDGELVSTWFFYKLLS
jgi:GNAT superfamily N-acetyltransferase